MSQQNDLPNYQLVTKQEELNSLVEHWQSEAYLAIDTEFMRTNTFYAKAGLIQIADSTDVYIIDPLLVGDLKPLAVVLEDDNIIKIMHSMSEDVELLYHLTGVQIKRVFDTQTAAAFLGYGASLGYQKLVLDVLNIELDKTETRSDWLKRPLSSSQLEYAAKDAEFLVLLFDKLKLELDKKELFESVFDETNSLVQQSFDMWDSPKTAYLKLRGAWDLPVSAQKQLQALVMWRDSLAQERNEPKSWVFSDAILIQVAQNRITAFDDLKRLKGMQFKSLKKYGDLLIELIGDYQELAGEFDLIDAPVKGAELEMYQKLKKIVSSVSEESGIAAQSLGSRKMLERIVIHVCRKKNSTLPNEFLGWRKKWLGQKMQLALGIEVI